MPFQLGLYQIDSLEQDIAVDEPIHRALAREATVAIGVSGGKDSTAVAVRTLEYLNEIGHRGNRLLIWADLGRLEWRASLPTCQALADRLQLELRVVRRKRGDLLARWEQRWLSNLTRYADLSCVRLIMPWSSAAMRFCSGELKTSVICQELVRAFPQRTILSVSGIRRDESSARAQAPISRLQPKLERKIAKTTGFDWHPIIYWTRSGVLDFLEKRRLGLHEAYVRYGSSRVSCIFCILSSRRDLAAAAQCADNIDVYRDLVDLEARSTFSFQADYWLADVATLLLPPQLQAKVQRSKGAARIRQEAENEIPLHLLYEGGWPKLIPTWSEAVLLSQVRRTVAEAVGVSVEYLAPEAILERYQNLKTRQLAEQ